MEQGEQDSPVLGKGRDGWENQYLARMEVERDIMHDKDTWKGVSCHLEEPSSATVPWVNEQLNEKNELKIGNSKESSQSEQVLK